MDSLCEPDSPACLSAFGAVENEQALLESERPFQMLADFVPQLMWMANADGWIYWYNQRWYEYTGASQTEMEGWGWQSVHESGVLPQVLARWQASIKTQEPFEMVFPLRGADGIYRSFLTRATPIKDRSGKVLRWLGTNTDISEQKTVEAVLQEKEASLRAIFEATPECIKIVEPDGALRYMNPAGLKMIEAPGVLDTVRNACVFDLIVPEHREQWIENHRKVCQGERLIWEFDMVGLQGTRRRLETHAVPLLATDGRCMQLAVTHDVTEQRKAESILKESEARFRLLAESAPLLIAMADSGANATYYNTAWLDYTGKTMDNLLGLGWVDCLHPDERDAFVAEFMAANDLRETFQKETRLRRYDGVYRWFLVGGTPRFSEMGEFMGYIETGTDIHELKELQQEYQALFAHTLDAIVIVNEQGAILNANPAACKKLGLELAQVAGQSAQTVFLPHAPEEFNALWQAFINQGVLDGELPYIMPDGSHKVFEYSAVANYVPGKHLSVIRDITERKRTEAILKESENRFKAMADSAPLFIWLSDAAGRTTYVNETWSEFLGVPVTDADEAIIKAMLPEDHAVVTAKWQESVAQQKPYTTECRFRRHDGEVRWLLIKGAPLFLPDGPVIGYIGTSIDITDRKLAEEQVQNSLQREQLVRRIMEITSQSFDIDFILQTVAEEVGNYLDADRASVVRYSVVNDEFIYTMSADYHRSGLMPVDPQDVELIMNAVRHLTPQTLVENQAQIMTVQGQEKFLEYLTAEWEKISYDLPGLTLEKLLEIATKYEIQSSLRVNILYRGIPYGNMSVSQCTYNRAWTPDEVELVKTIAEHAGSAIYQAELYNTAQETAAKEHDARKKLERYAQKLEISNRELEQFATIASHDLQEPLRKVQMFSQMVVENASEENRDYIDRMQKAVTRMQDLINDLLLLSRVNRQGRAFGQVSLNQCVQNALDELELVIQETKPLITVEPMPVMKVDRRQIEQLFLNLIGNALKFSRPDVRPEVQIAGKVIPGNFYQITVSDNGIGFNQKYRERVFEPFERLHGKFEYPGTGMGLTISRKIVERHGGTITAMGSEDQGASFIFTLPMGALQ